MPWRIKAFLHSLMARLGYVPRTLYLGDLYRVTEERDKMHDNLRTLYWKLGLQPKGLPPVRLRKLNQPKDERMEEALRKIDELYVRSVGV